MVNTYSCLNVHCVFSTKDREPCLTGELEERHRSYLGGTVRKHKMKALAVGGTSDHVHLLITLPATMAVAVAMRLVKGSSTWWVRENFATHRKFKWQAGYGAFSVSPSQMEQTIAYIMNQKEHHRGRTFQEEYLAFLEKYGIEFDERYLWT